MDTNDSDNVVYLPSADQDTRVEPVSSPQDDVIEGEIITDEDYVRLTSQKAQALARYEGYRQDLATVVRVTRTVATHQRTTSTAKAVMRHGLAYPIAGAGIAIKQWRDTHGANRYERQMRAAESAGDQDGLRYWQEADVAEKQRRHDRTMDWLNAPARLLKAAGYGLAGTSGLLLCVGVVMAINDSDVTEVISPFQAIIEAIATLVWFFSTYGMLLVTGATVGGVAYLYWLGKRHAELPTWVSAPAGEAHMMDEIPDENTILNALKNLNISGFNKSIKDGWRIKFVQPPVADGKGWRAQLALPPACPVSEIVKRKKTLAHNLVRYENEVWPTEPQPSVLDLWVAKQGALSGPVDPWPLLEDLDNAQTDYFAGVPVGVTIQGTVVRGRLSEANYAIGGMMGSGKSTLVITLIHGAMLDPLVDIDVVVMAENADYDPMKRRLRSLTTGANGETVQTCLAKLAQLYEELEVRGAALKEHDERFVTRKLAEKDDRLRPRILVIDECQALFMGEHGKKAIELAAKLISAARKYAITLIFLTPEPSKDALPRKITSVCSNKACFAIGDQMGNDAVLGTGSYTAGISAVGLVPKTDEGPGDVGTCMARGFTAQPGLLRTFYNSQEVAHRITDRAVQLLEQHGRTARTAIEAPKDRDVLADVLEVCGSEQAVKPKDVAARLRKLAPHHASYAELTGEALERQLEALGVRPGSKGGVPWVRTERVRHALAERDLGEDDDDV